MGSDICSSFLKQKKIINWVRHNKNPNIFAIKVWYFCPSLITFNIAQTSHIIVLIIPGIALNNVYLSEILCFLNKKNQSLKVNIQKY